MTGYNGTKIFGKKYGNAAYVMPPAALDSVSQMPNLVPPTTACTDVPTRPSSCRSLRRLRRTNSAR
jgi:hypothetical protein